MNYLFTSALLIAIVKPFGDLRAFVIGVVGESSMEWAQWETEKGEVDILDTGRADLRSFYQKGEKNGHVARESQLKEEGCF